MDTKKRLKMEACEAKNKKFSHKMEDSKAKDRRVFYKLFAIGVMFIILLLVSLIKLSTELSEFFAKWLSRPYRTAAGFVTSFFPFSVTEVLIVAAVIAGICFLISILICCVRHKKHRIFGKLVSLVLVVSSVITLYSLTAGFDYARPEINKPWLTQDASIEEYKAAVFAHAGEAKRLAESFKKDGNSVTLSPYTFEEIAKIMQNEVQRYAGGDYGWYAPLPKKVLNSWEMDMTSILGVTFAPTNEVNMNGSITSLYLPYYMAHELAHAMGIMQEREANIFAAYITLNSENDFVRYSGYRSTIYELIFPLFAIEGEGVLAEFRRQLGESYKKDNVVPHYIPKVPAYFDEISRFLNDLYLKISGLSDGAGNYDTGDSNVVLPPDGGVPTIQYSEIQKIYLYIR